MRTPALFLSILLLCGFIVPAQNKTPSNNIIDALAQKLKADPENPLQINKESLAEIAGRLPDGQLKNKLLNYSTRIGVDEGLGMRQVYWDLNEALEQKLPPDVQVKYAEIRQQVDLLFNQSGLVVRALKGDLKGIKATDFLNDPAFSAALNKLTGSPNTSMGLAMSISGITDLIASINETKKWKADYKNLSDISKHLISTEIDGALASALMQPYVGKTFSVIGPNFRYEFDNGNTLMVENKILKLVDPSNKTIRTLVRVGDVNNGIYKNASSSPTARLVIDPNERYFLIVGYVGDNTVKEFQCRDCELKNGKSILDARTGATINELRQYADEGIVFLENGFESWVSTSHTKPERARLFIPYTAKKVDKIKTSFDPGGEDSKFKINGQEVKSGDALDRLDLHLAGAFQIGLIIGSSGALSTSFWDPAVEKRQPIYYTSSYLKVSMNGQTEAAHFTNRIAGIETDKAGFLYVIGANGSLTRIDAKDHANVESLYAAIEKGLSGPSKVSTYDFTEPQDARVFDVTSANGTAFYEFPQLKLTPDQKQLVYIMRDEMYVIDVTTLSNIKNFKLSFKPSYIFFGKENKSWTLFLNGENEFAFPISKKYSMKKLVAASTHVLSTPVASQPPVKESTQPLSVADEILKLKKLLDAGVISKAEFEQGKKKLLAENKNK